MPQGSIGHSQVLGELLIETIDDRYPFLAFGDLVQFVFQASGEIYRKYIGEVLDQQVGDNCAHLCGLQSSLILIDVSALLNRGNDRRIG